MTGTVQIRAAAPTDCALLEALHQACCTADWDEAWSGKSFAEILAMPGSIGLLAESPDEPLGFALGRLAGDEAEVLLIATHPAHRRRGVATILLADLIDRLTKAGAGRVFLEVAAPNADALALYRRAGFVVVGRRPNYYRSRTGQTGLPTFDAMLLASKLPVRS